MAGVGQTVARIGQTVDGVGKSGINVMGVVQTVADGMTLVGTGQKVSGSVRSEDVKLASNEEVRVKNKQNVNVAIVGQRVTGSDVKRHEVTEENCGEERQKVPGVGLQVAESGLMEIGKKAFGVDEDAELVTEKNSAEVKLSMSQNAAVTHKNVIKYPNVSIQVVHKDSNQGRQSYKDRYRHENNPSGHKRAKETVTDQKRLESSVKIIEDLQSTEDTPIIPKTQNKEPEHEPKIKSPLISNEERLKPNEDIPNIPESAPNLPEHLPNSPEQRRDAPKQPPSTPEQPPSTPESPSLPEVDPTASEVARMVGNVVSPTDIPILVF